MTKIAITNEFATAILSNNIPESNIGALKSDAKKFIETELGIDVSSVSEITVVENGDSNIHLTLPYYSGVDAMNSSAVNEDDLQSANGGEVIFTIAGLITASIWGGVGYAADKHLNPDKYDEHGKLKK